MADALSRIQAINMPVIVTTDELYEEQQKDEELQTLLRTKTALTLKELRLDDGEKALYCEITDRIRTYVPKSLRRRMFDVIHKVSHPSGRTTRKMIAGRFVWPNMQKDITYWAKTCMACQRAKIHRHNTRSPEHIPVPDDIHTRTLRRGWTSTSIAGIPILSHNNRQNNQMARSHTDSRLYGRDNNYCLFQRMDRKIRSASDDYHR